MRRPYILFDLDGTLTDPMVGITRSVQHALRAYGIEVEDLKDLCPFIGPPLKDSFMKYYDFPEEQAQEAIGRYREYFAVTGIFENRVYDGITEMLIKLKEDKRTLLVRYFDWVCGASMDEKRVKKGDVIAYAMEMAGIKDAKEAVMVGDREHDILGAAQNSMDCVGVLFGYGSRQELEEAGAKRIAATVEELEEILLGDHIIE